jgi:hypothetical protein
MRIAPRSRHTSRMLVLTPEAVGAVVEFVAGQDAGTAAGLRISPARTRPSTERGITPSCTSPSKATS